MKIQVTQKHLDKGVRGSCSSDPIALAMKDAGLRNPWVSPTEVKWEGGSTPTPDGLLYFMEAFDNREYCFPFEFDLEATNAAQKANS